LRNGQPCPRAKVIALVGSLRKEPFNRKITNALIALNAAPLKSQVDEDQPASL
jgi:NAD(P)H-dependent FMN reductase